MQESDYYNYSLPLAPGGRDFAFSMPDDLTAAEADLVLKLLGLVVPAMAIREQPNLELFNGPDEPKDDLRAALECVNTRSAYPGADAGNSAPPYSEVHPDDNNGAEVDTNVAFAAKTVNKPAPALHYRLPEGKWAKEHDRCIECGRTDRPHMAKGLCKPCYATDAKRRSRGKQLLKGDGPVKLARWAFAHDRCVACGTTEKAHAARGLCQECYDRDRNGNPAPAQAPSSTARATKAPDPAVQMNATKPATNVRGSTVPTPTQKAEWPLKSKGVTSVEALKYCTRLKPYWDGPMTLDEVATREGLDADKLRSIADVFRRDIDIAMDSKGFESSLMGSWERRYR